MPQKRFVQYIDPAEPEEMVGQRQISGMKQQCEPIGAPTLDYGNRCEKEDKGNSCEKDYETAPRHLIDRVGELFTRSTLPSATLTTCSWLLPQLPPSLRAFDLPMLSEASQSHSGFAPLPRAGSSSTSTHAEPSPNPNTQRNHPDTEQDLSSQPKIKIGDSKGCLRS